jgi:hypothetical protein
MTVHQGKCFCGTVQFTVSGEPEAMGYCHCESCRSWSAGPVNAFTLWKPAAVKVTAGAEHIGTFNKTPHSLETKLRLHDGLPKMKDMPKEMGGSGVALAE